MDVFLVVLAVGLVMLGLAGVVLPLLPGTPLIFAGLWLGASLDGYQHVGGWTVLALGLVALLAWLVDYLAAAVLVKRWAARARQPRVQGWAQWPGCLPVCRGSSWAR